MRQETILAREKRAQRVQKLKKKRESAVKRTNGQCSIQPEALSPDGVIVRNVSVPNCVSLGNSSHRTEFTASQSPAAGLDLSQFSKEERRKIKNRESAWKNRMEKQNKVNIYEDRIMQLERENEMLKKQLAFCLSNDNHNLSLQDLSTKMHCFNEPAVFPRSIIAPF